MYFSYFPTMPYDANGDGDITLVTNILRRVRVRANVQKNLALLVKYPIQDGETPEIVADKHFNNPQYHWIILLLNGITDPYHDWCKSQRQMQLYLNNKYGSAINDVHHYEITQSSGDTTVTIDIGTDNTDYPSATTVTNFEYEEKEQDKKRQIRIIRAQYLDQIINEFEAALNESVV